MISSKRNNVKTEAHVTPGSLKAWVLAARPKTLSAAAVPVVMAAVMGIIDMGTEWQYGVIPALMCLAFALVMQVDANFVNDLFDYRNGGDGEERLGPLRACAQGWLSDRSMMRGIVVTTAFACLIGLPLVGYGGWQMIIIGVACVVFCFLYTTFFSRKALGDVLVVLFFGVVPVCTTYYLVTSGATPAAGDCYPFAGTRWADIALTIPSAHIPWHVTGMSIACGLIIDTLLAINNYRDIDNDRRSNKLTVAVLLGRKRAATFYYWVGVAGACIAIIAACTCSPANVGILFAALLYAFVHRKTYQRMKEIAQGRRLNAILGETARNISIFGCAVAVEWLLYALVTL